jgi:steroid 5-alpha reductase family enzyme
LIVLILATFVISFTATYWAVRLTLYLQARHQKKKEAEAPHD